VVSQSIKLSETIHITVFLPKGFCAVSWMDHTFNCCQYPQLHSVEILKIEDDSEFKSVATTCLRYEKNRNEVFATSAKKIVEFPQFSV
jgi:hypothetical protein